MAYTNIDDPSAHFQIKLWTGSGQTNRTITNDGNSDLQPDMLWAKSRSSVTQHVIYDSTRGAGKQIFPNVTNAEGTAATGYNLTGFATDGFITGANQFNLISGGNEYVAWQWKANGGTTSSNTDGATTSTVQANTDAGFSIVTYTGTGSATTLGHGLGVAPAVLIVKNRSSALDWAVYHKNLTDAGYVIQLNTTDGQIDSGTNRWNHTDPTSSVFSVGSGQQTNQSGDSLVAYCFAEKQGYSKFGSYVGNGNDNGPFIYTGFKPAFVLTKGTNISQWRLYDSARSPNNVNINRLFPYSSSAEATDTDAGIDMLSNGFKIRGSGGDYNASGTTYIYMAFADNPLVTSTGIPTTAR
jgi:hypothetical protein